MFKLLAIPLLLLTALFAPIAPKPAIVYFKPETPVAAALNLTDSLDGQLIATTWIDTSTHQTWYGSTIWANRHRVTYAPNETMTKIHLNGVRTADLTTLQQNSLVLNVETLPAPASNLAFFLNQLRKITGHL